jgi:acetyl-CoA carboxylase biotin carboxyl carrier protein
MNIDLQQIQALLRLLEKRDVTEFEFEDEHVRLRLVRGVASSAPRETTAQIVAAPAAPAASPPTTDEASASANFITSPFVGTFYSAPAPGKPPFVSMGDMVKVGQTMCIIEAMKLMNEIESEFPCIIDERLVQDGQPVEFGTKLFRVRKL